MDRDIIRLECLKLVHRFDRPATQVISDAKSYENYVVGEDTKVEKSEPKKVPTKKSGNPDFLS